MTFEFTCEQKNFLDHPRSTHARLLAGPGTGKSTTIIEYASRLLSQDIHTVRFLTFTRAATAELTESMKEEIVVAFRPSTFHSFAISLVLKNPGSAYMQTPLRILTDWEWKNLVRPRIRSRLNTEGVTWRDVESLRRELAAAWESLTPDEDEAVDDETRARFMREWQDHCRLCGYTDISEVPFLLYTGLTDYPDEYDFGNIDLLIVDEYQDLNACDISCLRLLAERGVTVFAVGDDDQSIYQFRKADPEGIRRFCDEFSDAMDYPLTIAQRFGESILRCANYVIEFDHGRSPSKLPIVPKDDNPEGTVNLLSFAGGVAEAKGIAQIIRHLHSCESVPYEEIIVLCRTKTVTGPIINQLHEDGIQVATDDELKIALDDEQTQRIFALLRLLSNRQESLAWWTALSTTRNIGPAGIEKLLIYAEDNACRFGDAVLTCKELDILADVSTKPIAECIKSTVELLDSIVLPENAVWGNWILGLIDQGLLPELPEPIPEYLKRIDQRLLNDDTTLGQYIGQIEPMASDIASKKRNGFVRVMSMTASKGLTVHSCIVAGCDADIIPHSKADPNEESRLLYVAMTRAREHLYLTWAQRRTGPGARAGGSSNVGERRTYTRFLQNAPIRRVSGEAYIAQLGSADV